MTTNTAAYLAACNEFRKNPDLTDEECAELIGVKLDEHSRRVIQAARTDTGPHGGHLGVRIE
jgi:hypothetical protein